MKKTILFLIILAVAACNEVDRMDSEEKLQLSISASPVSTKATDVAYEDGDAVGLYVVNYQGSSAGTLTNSNNHINNQQFTLYSGKWNANQDLYWKDKITHADFYCYYPYVSTISDVTNLRFSVSCDQNVESNHNLSDFHWSKTADVAPSQNAVSLVNDHIMSRVKVKLNGGSDFTEEELSGAEVTLLGLDTEAIINLATGSVSANGSSSSIKPYSTDGMYIAYVVPQHIDNAELVRISFGGNTFVSRQTVTFVSGKSHNCIITLKKTSQGVNVGIGNWDEGDTFTGSAE